MTRFLKPVSLLLLLFVSCASPYRHLQEQSVNFSSALRFRPEFDKVLYRCVVDGRFAFRKFHLSGLLFFKKMEDNSIRAVFQNEMGFTFFDFQWGAPSDSFQVNQIIPQLDKAALVKTLQKDFNLLLMKGLSPATEHVFQSGTETYHRFDLERGVVYYIAEQSKLQRIENVGKTKVITISLSGKNSDHDMPRSVVFDHHKANFTIRLNLIENAEN